MLLLFLGGCAPSSSPPSPARGQGKAVSAGRGRPLKKLAAEGRGAKYSAIRQPRVPRLFRLQALTQTHAAARTLDALAGPSTNCGNPARFHPNGGTSLSMALPRSLPVPPVVMHFCSPAPVAAHALAGPDRGPGCPFRPPPTRDQLLSSCGPQQTLSHSVASAPARPPFSGEGFLFVGTFGGNRSMWRGGRCLQPSSSTQ